MNIKRNILLTPGPATTTDTVKMAMVTPDICPREKEFVEVMGEVRKGLLKVVEADDSYTCILFAGSGTAVIDAVINSVVPPDKGVLIINNGAYGERMVRVAKAYGIKYTELSFDWDQPIDLNVVEETIEKDNTLSHVAVVHHETTTGMLNPLKEIGDISFSLGRKLIADTISSFAGIPIDIKRDHISFLMSTSNKCIQGMPGVSFVICNIEYVQETAKWPPRSFYLNLYQQHKYFQDHGEMQFTPPVQVIYALRQAIKEYMDEKAERFRRYERNWQVLSRGLRETGLDLLLQEDMQSKMLTTVIEPDHPGYDFGIMHDRLLDKGFTIYPGKMGKRGTFRIANIGAIDSKDIEGFLEALKETLVHMGICLR